MTDDQLVARARQVSSASKNWCRSTNGDLRSGMRMVSMWRRLRFGPASFLQAFVTFAVFARMPVSHWLFRIAINQCYNFLKSRRKFGDPIDCDELNLAGMSLPPRGLLPRTTPAALCGLGTAPRQAAAVIT